MTTISNKYNYICTFLLLNGSLDHACYDLADRGSKGYFALKRIVQFESNKFKAMHLKCCLNSNIFFKSLVNLNLNNFKKTPFQYV